MAGWKLRSADEVAFLIEVVVERAVDGGEFLEGLHPSKPLHGPLSSSERLVRILNPVGEPAAHLLTIGIADLLHGRPIGSMTIGDDSLRPAVALHRPLDEGERKIARHSKYLERRSDPIGANKALGSASVICGHVVGSP